MTQRQAVLEHLQTHGSITSLEAIQLYGATRLSDIIFNLRKRGYQIITEPFTVKTRFGGTARPAKYILQMDEEKAV